MKQIALENFPHMEWMVIGMLIFFLIFLSVLIWTGSTKRKTSFNQLSLLPFEKEEFDERRK